MHTITTRPAQRRAILEKIVGLGPLEKVATRGGFADDEPGTYACKDGLCLVGAILVDAGMFLDVAFPTAYRAERMLWDRANRDGEGLANDEFDVVSEVVTDLMALNDNGRLRTAGQVRRALGL